MAACHACHAAFDRTERVGFRAACEQCGAELHVCLNCRFHDPHASDACRESQAELVVDKDRANRCEWFQPGDEGGPVATDEDAARERVDALFRKPGEAPAKPAAKQDPRTAAEELFRKRR